MSKKEKKYRVQCDKERVFLEEGVRLEAIYGDLPFRGLTVWQAQDTAGQLNEWAVDGEVYLIAEEN